MDGRAIDGLLEQAVRAGALPGVVAIAGDRDGVLYEGAAGALSIGGDTPVQRDTMFWLASMTKAFVSVGALRLIEQDRLALEQPVADVLPAFGALPVLDGFDGDTPRLRPPASQATIRQLLTHTSGAGYWFANPDLLRYHLITGLPDPSTGKLASLLEAPLVADPGTRWEYGLSTDWLGLVVEAVSGQDLAAYCAEHIFEPLGMRDTTFIPTEAQASRAMRLHARTADGALVPASLEVSNPEYFSAGSGAWGTAPDYLRFMRALLRRGELDGKRVLRPETVELMFTDHLNGAPLPAVVRSTIPELTNDIPSWPVAQGWGLGLHLLLEEMPGMRRAGTGDWAGLTNCYFWIDRTTGRAAALFTQILPFFDAGVVETVFGFERSLYATLSAPAVG